MCKSQCIITCTYVCVIVYYCSIVSHVQQNNYLLTLSERMHIFGADGIYLLRQTVQ